jgi:hypothetical protein
MTLDLPCTVLGLLVPPGEVRLKFLPIAAGWVVLSRSFTAPGQVASWLEALRPMQLYAAPGPGQRVVRATVPSLPQPLEALLAAVGMRDLLVRAGGQAHLVVEGTRADLRAVRDRLGEGGTIEVVRVAHLEQGRGPALTPRQDRALREAARQGYYKVPREAHLEQLAAHLGTSPAALSELLRRAEARIVEHYLAGASPGMEEGQPRRGGVKR